MKTTDPRDPLDQKIDELLASQPVKAPTNFAARTLAQLDAEPATTEPASKKTDGLAPLIRFALPVAAAVALGFFVFTQFNQNNTKTPAEPSGLATTGAQQGEELNSYEIQEILMLQEGLSGFAQVETDELNSDALLDTLDTLYSI